MEEINDNSIVQIFKKKYRYNYNVAKMIFDICSEDVEKFLYSSIISEKGKKNYIEDYYEFIISEEEAFRCYYEAEYEIYISKLN